MRPSLLSAALVAALVGYGSTIALVLAAATAVGATAEQTQSWVFALCLMKAVGGALLTLRYRVPVVLAWSTPGAALVAATQGITMAEAAGAFLLAGVLVALTGALRPLGRMIAAIPDGIAAGMLAGVLLPFCLGLPQAAAAMPLQILPMLVVFVVVRARHPAWAVLAALATGMALTFATGEATSPDWPGGVARLVAVTPDFRPEVLLGLGLPLYLVTMASQNLPGFATLRAHGYVPPVNAALGMTGGLSTLGALAGAHTVSMAAITAALCMGPESHPDPAERWKAAMAYAGIWLLLGLFGPAILSVIMALPPALVSGLVGLALIGPFIGAATGAFAEPDQRFAAAMTLVVTASGVTAFGIGAAFWGLAAGMALQAAGRFAHT